MVEAFATDLDFAEKMFQMFKSDICHLPSGLDRTAQDVMKENMKKITVLIIESKANYETFGQGLRQMLVRVRGRENDHCD
jgi:hypothetical protein